MADTLESLEIEVKHNASNAAGDIQALADSIGHLKTNLSGVSGEMKALAAREVGSPCEWRGGARHCSRVM